MIDIETRPNRAYIWDIYNQYVAPERVIDEKEIISFAAKWVDEDNVTCLNPSTEGQFRAICRPVEGEQCQSAELSYLMRYSAVHRKAPNIVAVLSVIDVGQFTAIRTPPRTGKE